jgi:hypothetical protein
MKYLNVIALAAVIYINYLANAQPINGMNTGEISALYPNLFTPAGYTFSIWGVIYLFLGGFVIFSLIRDYPRHSRISFLFILTCLCNMAWIYAWHYLQTTLSVGIMLTFLVILLSLYFHLPFHEKDKGIRFFVVVPFSIYLAWICVATIANISAWLVDMQINPNYPQIWAFLMVVATIILVWVVTRHRYNPAFSLVIVWALTGILVTRWQAELIYPSLIGAIGAAIMLTIFITVQGYRRTRLT